MYLLRRRYKPKHTTSLDRLFTEAHKWQRQGAAASRRGEVGLVLSKTRNFSVGLVEIRRFDSCCNVCLFMLPPAHACKGHQVLALLAQQLWQGTPSPQLFVLFRFVHIQCLPPATWPSDTLFTSCGHSARNVETVHAQPLQPHARSGWWTLAHMKKW